MGRIEKEKNLVKFWIDGKAKPYILDINKGELVGLRGVKLSTIPPALSNMLYSIPNKSSVAKLLHQGIFPGRNAELYQLADRLDAIGISVGRWELGLLENHWSIINFKHLAKYLSSGEGDIEDYVRIVLREQWAVKNNLVIDDNFTEPMLNWLYQEMRSKSKETLHRIAYYLARGLWEYYDDDRYSLRSYINKFIKYTTALEIPMEKGDFFRQYINAQRAYRINEDTLVNKLITKNQQKRLSALSFENETFIVVVPTTKEELRAEGEHQRNCVGGYGSRIADGERNVVFIRKKSDPTYSYITCDIMSDGEINQYLVWGNRHPTDADALVFKRLYQQHLSTHWGE